MHSISLKLDFRNLRKVVKNIAGHVMLFASFTVATKMGWLKLIFNIACPNLNLLMSSITKNEIKNVLVAHKVTAQFYVF